ncbi:hypothetical protein ACFY2K_42070 [Kitasatospora sp. NPDC001309]|uniref:hypothetical protein n=1 Tax=Kitasatospora sp. NPDC001309 TaxID=3364013 RepID=UPI0036736D5D
MPEDAVPVRDERPNPDGWKVPPSLGDRLRPVARIVLALVGLALVVAGFVRFTADFEDVRRYHHTPLCTAPAQPSDDCATRESGRVTGKHLDPGSDSDPYTLTVARETAPAAEYGVGKAFYDDVTAGTTVDVTVLHGEVIEIGYHGHRSQTETYPWADAAVLSLLIAAGTALVLTQGWPLDDGVVPFVLAVTVVANVLATLLGSIALLTLQWPLVVTLIVAALCWIAATALFRGILNEFS